MPGAPIASKAIIANKQSSGHIDHYTMRIAELTIAKHSIDDIFRILKAEELNIPRGTIISTQQDLREQWRARTNIAVEEIVSEELVAMDKLQSTLWSQAMNGDLPTIDRLMKILEHRAKLLGLYAPSQVRVSGQIVTAKVYQGLSLEDM